jgi:hypothetical protein
LQGVAQRHRVNDRLCRSLTGMRQHRMRSVPKQRHDVSPPGRNRISIDQLVIAEIVGCRRDAPKRRVEARRHVRDDGRWIAQAGRDERARERQEPIDAGVAGAHDR